MWHSQAHAKILFAPVSWGSLKNWKKQKKQKKCRKTHPEKNTKGLISWSTYLDFAHSSPLRPLHNTQIEQDLNAYPTAPSHYGTRHRRSSDNPELYRDWVYLPSDLNYHRCWLSFLQRWDPNYDEFKAGKITKKEWKKTISFNTYMKIFKQFKLGFGSKKKDTCGTCDELFRIMVRHLCFFLFFCALQKNCHITLRWMCRNLWKVIPRKAAKCKKLLRSIMKKRGLEWRPFRIAWRSVSIILLFSLGCVQAKKQLRLMDNSIQTATTCSQLLGWY